MAVLVRTSGTHQGRWVYPLKDHYILGRHPDCDISDIFKEVAGVSRYHAEIESVEGQYFIQDKGSRNGTLVNKVRLVGKMPLRNGDRIDICGIQLTFNADSDSDRADSAETISPVDFVEALRKEPSPLASLPVAAPAQPAGMAGFSAERLRALVLMLKQLGRSLDVDETLRQLLTGLFDIFPQADRGFVAFADGPEKITPRATHFRRPEPGARLAMSRTLVGHVLSRREAILWTDNQPDLDMPSPGSMEALSIHAAMCAPLLDADGQPFGVVQIDTDQPSSSFAPDDLEVLVGAVSQAAMAVRYSRLYEDGLRRQAMERDMQLARRVQLSLLPAQAPPCEGYQFFAYYQTAYDVGGDYYDFIEIPNRRLAVVVADVAGKGVSAALLMAKLSGELKYYLSCESPRAAVARMNDSLINGGSDRFVTLLLAVLERDAPRLTLINAGHLAPLRRRRSGDVEVVGESHRGIALGILPGRDYHELQVEVELGDAWFVCTDGFTEAENAKGEMYGLARVREQLARHPGGVDVTGQAVVQDVQRFLAGEPQSDDMCLVGWSRLAGGAVPPGPAGFGAETAPLPR